VQHRQSTSIVKVRAGIWYPPNFAQNQGDNHNPMGCLPRFSKTNH
jgi:hypothetical protein